MLLACITTAADTLANESSLPFRHIQYKRTAILRLREASCDATRSAYAFSPRIQGWKH